VLAATGSLFRKQVLSWDSAVPQASREACHAKAENVTTVGNGQQQPMGVTVFSGADTWSTVKAGYYPIHTKHPPAPWHQQLNLSILTKFRTDCHFALPLNLNDEQLH
jgi:hypothetical protein